MDKVSWNLGEDYLQNAHNFICAAELLYKNSSEIISGSNFRIIDPLTFLIGHASELILKAGLAFKGYSEVSLKNHNKEHENFRHNLTALCLESEKNEIKIDGQFVSCIKQISENFKNYDHRYPRVFSGYAADEINRLSELNATLQDWTKSILKKI